MREGNLEAPTRHPIDWKSPDFYDEAAAFEEMERVFDICHGCRRCVSLCQSFPNLFDLVDATDDGEVHGVTKADYWKVVDQCYLCDLCYMTKCPYTPPHAVEPGLPAPDAARQGHQVQEGRGQGAARSSWPAPTCTASSPASRSSCRRSTRSTGRSSRASRWTRCSACTRTPGCPAWRRSASAGARPKSPSTRGDQRRAHAGQGGDLLHLLRQLQRARHRPRPAQAARRTTTSPT